MFATIRQVLVLPVIGVLAVLAAACGGEPSATGTSPPDEAPGQANAATFPVTIDHAFGTTEIETAPERVVSWGWGSNDAAIALGVVPVAMPYQAYGGDDQGVLPWVRERLESENVETPDVLPQSEEPPIEAIAAARPDIILAVYSGVTEDQYELLSEIAPTVAYPEEPWATPWRETIEIVGKALGKPDEAVELLGDIDRQIAEAAEAHPELAGKTVAMVWDNPDTFYVYKPADARVKFTLDLGLKNAPSVTELAQGEESFYYTLSKERLSELDSDILVSYANTQEASDAFLSSPAAQTMEQVQEGRVAEMVGEEFIAAVSPPTALSLTWGLEEYVQELSDAAQAVDEG